MVAGQDSMIRISKKADYAIFFMAHLARQSDADGDQPVSAQEFAEHIGLNKSVVANLLKDLAGHGLLRSVRGVHGGYCLARPSHEICLAEILEAVEGPFSLVECAYDLGTAKESAECSCALTSFCPSREPLQILHERIVLLMKELTLDELCTSPIAAISHSHPHAFASTAKLPQENRR